MLRLGMTACLLLSALGAGAAGFSSSGIGTTSGQFLGLGAGARAVAMGGAYSSAADDATALYWNPAAMTRVDKRSVTLMHAAYIASTYYDYGSYVQNTERYGAFGAGLQYFSYGSIDETGTPTNDLAPTGTVSPYDLAASVGYAYRFPGGFERENGWAVGLAGKYIESRLVDTAKTEALDAGLLSPAYFDHRLRLALTVQNLGGTLKYDQQKEYLPLTFKAGVSCRLARGWLLAADAVAPRSNGPYANVGSEYLFVNSEAWRLAGRAGFSSQVMSPSAGIGLGFKGFSVDYAFVLFNDLGDVHRVSLTFNF